MVLPSQLYTRPLLAQNFGYLTDFGLADSAASLDERARCCESEVARAAVGSVARPRYPKAGLTTHRMLSLVETSSSVRPSALPPHMMRNAGHRPRNQASDVLPLQSSRTFDIAANTRGVTSCQQKSKGLQNSKGLHQPLLLKRDALDGPTGACLPMHRPSFTASKSASVPYVASFEPSTAGAVASNATIRELGSASSRVIARPVPPRFSRVVMPELPGCGPCVSQLQRTIRDTLSKALDELPRAAAVRAGTPGFRAPEVLLGSPYQSTAVDVWSAGIILACLLSRRTPLFHGRNDFEHIACICALLGPEFLAGADAMGRPVTVVTGAAGVLHPTASDTCVPMLPNLQPVVISPQCAVQGLLSIMPVSREKEHGFLDALDLLVRVRAVRSPFHFTLPNHSSEIFCGSFDY